MRQLKGIRSPQMLFYPLTNVMLLKALLDSENNRLPLYC
jgi:hypothetical protein